MKSKSLNPYLTFNGNCAEAMTFYKNCLGGELIVRHFGNSPMEVPAEQKNQVMHSSLVVAEGMVIMASDGGNEHTGVQGGMVTLNINFADREEEIAVFNKLAEGGKITMPLADTFWGAYFGMLTDKYGIQWMMNSEAATQ